MQEPVLSQRFPTTSICELSSLPQLNMAYEIGVLRAVYVYLLLSGVLRHHIYRRF